MNSHVKILTSRPSLRKSDPYTLSSDTERCLPLALRLLYSEQSITFSWVRFLSKLLAQSYAEGLAIKIRNLPSSCYPSSWRASRVVGLGSWQGRHLVASHQMSTDYECLEKYYCCWQLTSHLSLYHCLKSQDYSVMHSPDWIPARRPLRPSLFGLISGKCTSHLIDSFHAIDAFSNG